MTSDRDSEFVALLTEHQMALRLYVQSLMPGNPSVNDVAQQANATVWKKREEFEIGTNFKAWLFSIARYEVLNFRKKEARDARLVFSDEMEEIFAEELPEYSLEQEGRQHALKSCLKALKEKDRQLILNRYFKRTPLQEYAEKVGRSVGGLKVTLHRIRSGLQGCIESKLKTGEAKS